ncbi:Nitroreductase-like protein [Lophiotrema nucula]|uniref:Nitroreductase-like protein n=1 Tax=Lophiotrema nucula TaxID=690887 RepID=A0A6A5YQV3_9PLEO|nr:Nitroreductase-like protein [Lophiotrema nucula]
MRSFFSCIGSSRKQSSKTTTSTYLSKMASTTPFLDAITERRSIYKISKETTIPNERILEIVNHALKYAPSPFNVRSTRCVVVFGNEHDKLWQEAYKITEQQTPQAMGILGPKIKDFISGYGTVLFFDDSTAYNALPPRFQALSKQFPEWEEHSSGMHQFIVWTALANEGLGASLQHYQPSITPYVKKTFEVPEFWNLKCQLVFGKPTAGAGERKPMVGLEGALKVFGAVVE